MDPAADASNALDELGQVFGEMEDGNYVEPTDEEFARAVHDRALTHMGE